MSEDNIISKGYLDVGDGYQMYYEEWGNPEGKPIFYLHGGPGSAFSDKAKIIFDPKMHHVIFHDQRGCGKSTPFADISQNTTQDLVNDIEKLCEHLKIEKLIIAGGSWGSTLALYYALAHPERVEKIFIWSVFLNRQFEVDWVNTGGPKIFFPYEWERFISLVPEKDRTSGDTIMQYYTKKIHGDTSEEALKYAHEWTLWESTLLSIEYDPKELEEEILEDQETISIAKLETHYFSNQCFMPQNYILDSVQKIAHILCFITQGRFDMCTPPISAYDLQKAYGKNCELTFVNSGHLRTDPNTLKQLQLTARTSLV